MSVSTAGEEMLVSSNVCMAMFPVTARVTAFLVTTVQHATSFVPVIV